MDVTYMLYLFIGSSKDIFYVRLKTKNCGHLFPPALQWLLEFVVDCFLPLIQAAIRTKNRSFYEALRGEAHSFSAQQQPRLLIPAPNQKSKQ